MYFVYFVYTFSFPIDQHHPLQSIHTLSYSTMAYPIHSRIADAYVAVLRRNILMTSPTEEVIHCLIRNLPARVTLDLLSQGENSLHIWVLAENGMDVDVDMEAIQTPYRTFFFMILNRIHICLDYPSWIPNDSSLTTSVSDILLRMYELEVNGGILPQERVQMYDLVNALIDDDNDDNASILTGTSTDVTEIMERPLNMYM